MELRRLRGHIEWHGVDARLAAGRSMVLSTTRPNGRPHAIPIWYWWDGTTLYFITARGTQKQRNLEKQPHIVAHFGDGDDVLFIEGTAHVVNDASEQQRVDDAWRQKYVDPVSGARASVFENALDDLYGVDVFRIVTWMYGTVGGWTEWRPER